MDVPIYVISLLGDTRRQRVKTHLDSLNIPFKFWDAFNGQQMGIKTSFGYDRDHDATYWATNPMFYVGPGVNALALTNFALIQHCLMSGYEDVIICEDDLVVVPDFLSSVDKIKANLPKDYDMCHLTWDCLHWKNPYKQYIDIGKCLTTACMLYSRKGMEKVHACRKTGVPYDIYLFDIFEPQYLAWPKLGYQRSISGEDKTTLS